MSGEHIDYILFRCVIVLQGGLMGRLEYRTISSGKELPRIRQVVPHKPHRCRENTSYHIPSALNSEIDVYLSGHNSEGKPLQTWKTDFMSAFVRDRPCVGAPKHSP